MRISPSAVARTMLYTTNHEPRKASFNVPALDDTFGRSYGWGDSLFRLTTISRDQGSDTQVRSYRYDLLGRIGRVWESRIVNGSCPPGGISVVDNGFDCLSPTQVTDTILGFRYDAAGNLTEQRDSTRSVTVTGSYATGNRITAWGGATYTSDLDGNVTGRTSGAVTTSYDWTADGRLKSAAKGAVTLSYDYNAFGQLVRRRRNGSVERHLLWDQDKLWLELDGTAANRIAGYGYLPGVDRPLALVTGAQAVATTRHFQQDVTGNVLGVQAGSTVAQYLGYTPWGESRVLSGTLADTNRLRWKGHVWEGDLTQLYHVRARWYDPESRRFMSEDPIGLAGGLNPYTYAGNDPVNNSDPSGSKCQAIVQYSYYLDTGEIVPGSFDILGFIGNCQLPGQGGGRGGRAFAPDATAMVAVPPSCDVEKFIFAGAMATDAAVFFPAVRATGKLGFWGLGQLLNGASGGVGQLLVRGATVRSEGILVSRITRQAADATNAAFNSGVQSVGISGGAIGLAAAARASRPNKGPGPSAWYDIFASTPRALRNLDACKATLDN